MAAQPVNGNIIEPTTASEPPGVDDPAARPAVVRPLAPERYKVQFTVSRPGRLRFENRHRPEADGPGCPSNARGLLALALPLFGCGLVAEAFIPEKRKAIAILTDALADTPFQPTSGAG